jgi:anti-sigma-K factor RskA
MVMNYDRPELGERLAADYVLGLMPVRARQRFEREIAGNATLAAAVAGWSERLAPLDSPTVAQIPPAHVWHRIEQRVGSAAPVRAKAPKRVGFFWRCSGMAIAAACAAIAIYVAVNPTPVRDEVAALTAKTGLDGWIASVRQAAPDIGLSTMRLGVPERERPRWLRAALLLTNDALPLTAEQPALPR